MALLTHQIIVAILLIKSFLMIMMNDQKRVPPQFPRVHNYHLPPVSFDQVAGCGFSNLIMQRFYSHIIRVQIFLDNIITVFI